VLGPDAADVAIALNNLAELYRPQAHYAEAEPLFKRALAIWEKALGPEHTRVGIALNNLAEICLAQGRDDEAEPLFNRSLAIREKALGPEHPDVAIALNNLATFYLSEGRYAEAEPLLKRALAVWEKALGPDHTSVGTALNNLAGLYRDQARYAEAEPLFQRSLAIREKALGSDHPDVGASLNNLAGLYDAQGRYAEAEPIFRRGLAIREKGLGPDHTDVGESLNNLAGLYFEQEDWARAADFWRRSTSVLTRRAQHGSADVGQVLTGKRKDEAQRSGERFSGFVKAAHRLGSQKGADVGLLGETFQAAQWALGSEVATSLAQMAARGAKGDPVLADLVRARQDFVGQWQMADRWRSAVVSQAAGERDRPRDDLILQLLVAIESNIAKIDGRLVAEFPEYAALSRPDTLSVAKVQAELHADEVLVLFLDTRERKPTPEETFIWVITKGDMRWVKSELGTNALKERVAALRCGLDRTAWSDTSSWPEVTDQQKREKVSQIARRQRCLELLSREPAEEIIEVGTKNEKIVVLPFDLARAQELYKGLLGPVEDMIEGKRLLIVPSGPLTSIPFNVLVTEPPKAGIPERLAQYRDVAWLGARSAITVLPSVASLKALRQFAKTSHAAKSYLGVGNPLLDGVQDDPLWGDYYKELAELARTKRCSQTPTPKQIASAAEPRSAHDFASNLRGVQADIEDVRSQDPLPETADELCEIARRLGVPESDILLGANATEGRLKDLSDQGRLADYAVVHFATHGTLTGQVQGLAEPGLILTPPPKGTSDPKALERDDGFLTASEITTLKLDADWVVLSACNTAGPQDEGAEALSGLARAFFYAGARALLVSHWAVGSDAAVKLTTRAFAELKAHPEIGRAEALRISMKELIEKGNLAEAHPRQWAPFVIVGEGSASR
jgi:CHAT domain-containing protein/tetratricopeptide (TPR) repeat protein